MFVCRRLAEASVLDREDGEEATEDEGQGHHQLNRLLQVRIAGAEVGHEGLASALAQGGAADADAAAEGLGEAQFENALVLRRPRGIKAVSLTLR